MPSNYDLSTAEDSACLLFFPGQMFYQRTTKDKASGAIKKASKSISPAQLRAAVNGLSLDTGWIDPNVRLLRWQLDGKDEVTLIYTPPHRDLLRLVDENGKLESLMVPLPGLVFAARRESYSAWAVKELPTPTSMLYRAPFPNIYHDGAVCWGDNAHEPSGPGFAQRSLATFLHTPFTSHNVDQASNHFMLDVRVLWEGLAGVRELAIPAFDGASFPETELVPTGWTVDYGYKHFVNPPKKPTQTIVPATANMRPAGMP